MVNCRQHSRELLAAQERFELVAKECNEKIAQAEDEAAQHQEISRKAEEEREKAEMRARGKHREMAMQRLDLQTDIKKEQKAKTDLQTEIVALKSRLKAANS